ncbi:TPA: hypothetical protein CPU00_02740 [Candidatus Gastranaerophilales bacterium HUM_18]|nr:MAG TPA: hypothetical protein CPU00_02740 [Candidatus Gastranaerophilales bacterium HUM_18]
MSGNTPFIVQTNTQAKGFSLAEVLIVVACVIVIAVLCLQVLKKIIPDREARMFKKAYNLTTRLVPSMVHDEDLYPEVDGKNAPQFFGNTEWVIYEGKKYEGPTKFCGLFAAKLNVVSSVSCSANASLDGKATLTTNDGVAWVLPVTEFKDLKTPGIIQIDTNGAKKPNKEGYDRYKIYVYQDGTVSNNPVDMPDLPAVNNDTNSSDNSEDSNSKDDSNGSGSGGSITIEIEIKIDSNEINYSSINGYGTGEIYERGKGWGGSRDKAYAKGQEVLNNSNLKSQMKAQIESMLEAKGIPFEKIETVFENIYNQSVADTLNAKGMITGRGARGLSKKGKAYINIKNMVDSFVNTFNTNIAKAIDEMNGSNKDMDLWDIDYTQTVTDDDGNVDQELLEAMQDGSSISGEYAFVYELKAEKMIDKLQSTMLMKAKAMCDANGIEFDLTVFNTMFNNAKSSAVASSIETKDVAIGFQMFTEATINPQNLVKTFMTNFKDSYTAWVNAETK